MIVRTFHPIGQGAFYTEMHNGFNMVYDCGVWKNTSRKDAMIASSFPNASIIDCLFISHFDFDHVSKINVLKTNFNIRKVIIPFLNEKEKKLLAAVHEELGNHSVSSLIRDPNAFFGDKTSVTVVEATDNGEIAIINDPVDFSSLKDKILSGTPIHLLGKDWIFIPYNHCISSQQNVLIAELEKISVDVSKFHDLDLDYIHSHKAEIRLAYTRLNGSINQNSMVLYSGPQTIPSTRRFLNLFSRNHLFQYWKNGYSTMINNKIGCVYTGDANLSKTNISEIFSKYWRNVGTIQIPHHGSEKDFNISVFQNGPHFCPISFGNQNTYGHPNSNTISDLINSGSVPFLVSDSADSALIEIIG